MSRHPFFHLKTTTFPLLPIIVGMLLLGFFCTGISSHADMPMTSMHTPIAAPQSMPCCNLTVTQHLASWKTTFSSLPYDNTPITLLILAGMLACLAGHATRRRGMIEHKKTIALSRAQRQERFHTTTRDVVLRAFAAGILHPKTY